MDRVPIINLKPEIDSLREALNRAFDEVLTSAQFVNGPAVKGFEQDVAGYLGAKHAVGLNSGTDALVIGLRSLGIEPEDEVITSPFTFFATAEAVSSIGAVPVFVDVDPSTFNLDVAQIESRITKRTKAILPVHMFGHAAQMDEIMSIARQHGLKVLEDNAQAFSGRYREKKLGTIGDVGAYSFFPSKNLGCFGDGGLLTTDDDEIAATARMLGAHGSRTKYFNEVIGYNSRLDSLQAAFLRIKLPLVEQASEGRRRVAMRYAEQLAGIPAMVLPTEAAYARHVYHQYTIRFQERDGRRDDVQKKLAAAGVDTMIYYPRPLHRLPMYAHAARSLPVAEQLPSCVLSLPIWPQMTESEQDRVTNALKKAMR